MLSYLPLAHIVERAGVEAIACCSGSRLFFTEGIDTFLDGSAARASHAFSFPCRGCC